MDSTTQSCSKIPRRDLSLGTKIALLDQIRSQPPNTSHRKLADITGVPKSTITRLIHQEDKLRQEWSVCEGQSGTRKRKRVGKDPDVEEALNQWFLAMTRRGMHVSGTILKSKSEEFAKELGHTDFKATDGWLSRWKYRHETIFKNSEIEKSMADSKNVDQWKSIKLPELLQKYNAEDIYSVSETGLFYRALPDSSLCYKQTKPKDHVTVLCCTNMSGTNKRKLLVVGKTTNPRSFIGLRRNALPIQYTSNKNAWINSRIFQKWLVEWNAELQTQSRNVVLLLVNCPAHPFLFLKNIQLEYLPHNTISLQPMEMGIITNLKTLYRRKLINHIETEINNTSGTCTDRSGSVNLLEALQILSDSWRKISIKTIQNCFAQCGFKHPNHELSDENGILEEPYFGNYEFTCIDNSLQCYNEIDDEVEMVDENTSVHEDSDEDEVVPVTNEDAKKFIAGLRRYFMQEGNECSPISALDICADFVHLQTFKMKQQDLLSTSKTAEFAIEGEENDWPNKNYNSPPRETESIFLPVKREREDFEDEENESTGDHTFESSDLVAGDETAFPGSSMPVTNKADLCIHGATKGSIKGINSTKKTNCVTDSDELSYNSNIIEDGIIVKLEPEILMNCGEDELETDTTTEPSSSNPSDCSSSEISNKKQTKTSKRKNIFKCAYCIKTFTRISHMVQHQRIHTGEKPFRCEQCHKTFTQNSNLLKHKLLHSGFRPYGCGECGKKFSQNTHLVQHRLIHTGQKPYMCEHCGRSFSQNQNLIKHRRIHTAQNN